MLQHDEQGTKQIVGVLHIPHGQSWRGSVKDWHLLIFQ
jgi:hypothetical protein